jgi:glycosyltransferase involved in cell wall biosynthesis
MNLLMVGVDRSRKGGMWSVVENYLNDEEFSRETNLVYIPTSTLGSIPHRLIFSAKAFYTIRKLLRNKKIDIVHLHIAEKGSTFRAGIIEKIVKKYKCKIIIQIHAEYKNWYFRSGKIVQKAIRNILQNADCLLVLGEYWKSFFSQLVKSPTKIKIFYNGVSQPASNQYENNASYLLYFGVLNQQKGIFDLLNAIQLIDDDLPPSYKVAVCGIDSDGSVQREVEKLGLSNRVEMMGWIGNHQKAEILGQTCIHILPSYSEAMPMSILETMAWGIPNIATMTGAVPEIIQNGKNGFLIQPGDVEGLAEAIKRMVTDRAKRAEFSVESYKTISEKFSLAKIKSDLLSIYREF